MRSIFRFLEFGQVLGFTDYLGPDTALPLASILAVLAGFFLLFWRIIVKFIKRVYRSVRGLPPEVPPEPELEDSPEDEPNP
jgi:hypothetical protein